MNKLILLLFSLLLFNNLAISQDNCTISLERANFSPAGNSPMGQSFTACQTGTFNSLSVWHGAFSSPGTDITLSIYEGEIISNPIYTQFLGDLAPASFSNPKRTISLTSPVPVVNGQLYTYVFSGTFGFITFQSPGDVYEGGRSYTGSGFDERGRDFTFEISIVPGVVSSCMPTVEINNTTASGGYVASETISTLNTVEVLASATFKAGQLITLNEGFHAKTGSDFLATIEDCTPVNSMNKLDVVVARATFINENKTAFKSFSQANIAITPNPFVGVTKIAFNLEATETLDILVQNVSGAVIQTLAKQQVFSKGTHELAFDGTGQLAGMYTVVILSKTQAISHKMVLIK